MFSDIPPTFIFSLSSAECQLHLHLLPKMFVALEFSRVSSTSMFLLPRYAQSIFICLIYYLFNLKSMLILIFLICFFRFRWFILLLIILLSLGWKNCKFLPLYIEYRRIVYEFLLVFVWWFWSSYFMLWLVTYALFSNNRIRYLYSSFDCLCWMAGV